MTTKDALLEAARNARGRAEYFEARAGRRQSKKTDAAREPFERAAAERNAVAFETAAMMIETLAEQRKWP